MQPTPTPPEPGAQPPDRVPLDALPGVADIVWAALYALGDERHDARLAFVAPRAGTGTSVLAAASARQLARLPGVRACLVETNLQRPAAAAYLGLRCAGLSDVLDGRVPLEEALQACGDRPGLLVLPAGTRRAIRPGEFAGDRMADLLARLEALADHLVIDVPPVLEDAAALSVLQHADGVVLVQGADAAGLVEAADAQRVLEGHGVPVLGSILNHHQPPRTHAGTPRVETASPSPGPQAHPAGGAGADARVPPAGDTDSLRSRSTLVQRPVATRATSGAAPRTSRWKALRDLLRPGSARTRPGLAFRDGGESGS